MAGRPRSWARARPATSPSWCRAGAIWANTSTITRCGSPPGWRRRARCIWLPTSPRSRACSNGRERGRRGSGSIWRARIRRPRRSPDSQPRWMRCWRVGVARGVNARGPRWSCGRATASGGWRGRVGSDRFSRGTGDGNAPARGAEGSANRCARPHARRRTMPSRATLRRSRSRRMQPPPRRRWRCDRGWRPGASRTMYRHRASAPEAGPGGSVRIPGRLSLSAVARGSPFGLSFAP